MSKTVKAGREFVYAGVVREQGEIFVLAGARNDEKLIRHGHAKSVTKSELNGARRCDPCAKSFIGDDTYNVHLNGRIHPGSPNFEGEQARTTRAQPVKNRRELLAEPVGPGGHVTTVW